MNAGDRIALANLVVSTLIALCAIAIAFLALKHTARPNINALMLNSFDEVLACDTETKFIFEVYNVGYWYGSAPAINVTVYCNFDPAFELIELRYGSIQEITSTHVRTGKGELKYIRAKGLKLSHRGQAERIHVLARTPCDEGSYGININAFSENGASVKREFKIQCRRMS